MISPKGLAVLLKFPFRVLVQLLCHYTIGTPYRKFRNSLVQALKLTLFRAGIMMPIWDAKYINVLSAPTLVKKVLPLRFKKTIAGLPGYGEPYDDQSFWLVKQPNREKHDPILIFLHGGGFYVETQPFQLESVLAIHGLVEPQKRDKLSILYLDYKLAGDGYPLPYQLNQLAHTYQRLTQTDGNTNIILLGDSAGGNMTVTFLQKIAHHNRQDPKKLIYPTSAILISPWVNLQPSRAQFSPGRSFYENRRRDMLEYSLTRNLEKIDALVPPAVQVRQPELLLSPHSHPNPKKEHWDEIETFRSEKCSVFLIVGEDEVFRDDVLEWAEYALGVPLVKNKYGDSNNVFDKQKHQYVANTGALVKAYVEPWGIHDACLFFENGLLSRLQSGKADWKNVPDEYFGLKRIGQFLNETL